MDLVFAPSQIETWPIDRLRPYARNAKMHGDDQVLRLAASMAKFGWTVPCMVADDGELIAGHGRVLAATMLGLKDVPVIRLSHLDEAERRAYRIADNKLTELGEWDEAILRDEIAGLLAEDFDLSLLGITTLATPTVFGAPEIVLLDLPQLRDDQPAHRPLIAAHAKPWPGELAVYRSAATDGFALLSTFGTRASIGVLAADLFAGPVSRFDHGNALLVDLFSGTLESVTDLALFGGANALAMETAPGQWEIVQAGSAELIAAGRYRLTRLLRGQRGTEGAVVSIVPSGARVVVLDSALASLPISEADLGLPWNWRIGPASKPLSDETYVAVSFAPGGVGLRPFSVAHVAQPWRFARSPGDLILRWVRRSRSLAADSWGAGDVPLAEETEAYEVDILEGGAVRRTLTTSTTSVLYTAAQQSADWGASLGPGQTLDIRIFQLSALIGRGAAHNATLSF